MKLINADEAFRVLSAYYHHRTEEQHDALREALDRVPEAVVRCRDCKYIGLPLSPTDYNACKHKRAMVYAPVDGFCCWGERRTDVD